MLADEFRTLRRRQDEVRDRLDRKPRGSSGTAKFVGKVFNAGAMPGTVPGQFAVHPVVVSGTESEGSATGAAVDTGHTRVVTVLGPRVPVVDDLLAARLIGGRWVAGLGGGTSPTDCDTSAWPSTLHGTGPTLTIFKVGLTNIWSATGHVAGYSYSPFTTPNCTANPAVDVGFTLQCVSGVVQFFYQYHLGSCPGPSFTCSYQASSSSFGTTLIPVTVNGIVTSFSNSPFALSGVWETIVYGSGTYAGVPTYCPLQPFTGSFTVSP